MVMARFAPGERVPGERGTAYMEFIWAVNDARPGTFGTPNHLEDKPAPGYVTEEYPEARVIHGPGDEGVRIVATSDAAAAAFRTAAQVRGIHLAGPDPEKCPERGATERTYTGIADRSVGDAVLPSAVRENCAKCGAVLAFNTANNRHTR